MIYVDTSVVLAQLLSESTRPPPDFWNEALATSRLTSYEAWTRIHARKRGTTHGDDLTAILGHISILELMPQVLARALEPFPIAVRTLDALHLASASFLEANGQRVTFASYDVRLLDAAKAIGLEALQP